MDQLPQLRNELVPGRGTVVCERERTQWVEKVLVSGSGEAVGSQVCSVDLSASGGGALRRLSSDRQGPGLQLLTKRYLLISLHTLDYLY